MKEKIVSLGAFMALAGVVSIVLYFLDMNLKILMWIDLWGETIGWVIRGGLIVAGAVLFFLFNSAEDDETSEEAE